MGLSRQWRIGILLVIDTSFFFVVCPFRKKRLSSPLTNAQELVTGYIVGSLALVADSFHMLKSVYSSLLRHVTNGASVMSSPSSSHFTQSNSPPPLLQRKTPTAGNEPRSWARSSTVSSLLHFALVSLLRRLDGSSPLPRSATRRSSSLWEDWGW